jgi:hypothetical protein
MCADCALTVQVYRPEGDDGDDLLSICAATNTLNVRVALSVLHICHASHCQCDKYVTQLTFGVTKLLFEYPFLATFSIRYPHDRTAFAMGIKLFF